MNTRNSIFIFDLKGKYINKITSYGYYFDRYFFDDFFIDKENEILGFADCNKRRIFYFSYSGEFLSEKWIKKEIIEQATQYFLINENTMLLTQINNNNSVFNYLILDIDKNAY